MEKGFGYSVVPSIAFAAHALNESMFFENCSETGTRILNTTVAVDHQSLVRLASHYGFV
jgi:hypothetical protein